VRGGRGRFQELHERVSHRVQCACENVWEPCTGRVKYVRAWLLK